MFKITNAVAMMGAAYLHSMAAGVEDFYKRSVPTGKAIVGALEEVNVVLMAVTKEVVAFKNHPALKAAQARLEKLNKVDDPEGSSDISASMNAVFKELKNNIKLLEKEFDVTPRRRVRKSKTSSEAVN